MEGLADPNTAFYIGNSLNDKTNMKSNLQAFYKDTNPKNPVVLPTDEMKIWTAYSNLSIVLMNEGLERKTFHT